MHLQQRLVSTLLVTTMMLGVSPLPFVATRQRQAKQFITSFFPPAKAATALGATAPPSMKAPITEYDYHLDLGPLRVTTM